MKKLNLLALSAAVAGALVSGAASAELTGNIGLSNNYLWRGVTQNADEAAISGGIDYAHDSGLYAGTWTSNLENGSYELDLYFGFGGEAGALTYDVGFIQYMYPVDEDLDFAEVYAGVDVAGFEFDLAYTINSDAGGEDANIYTSLGYAFDLGDDLSLGLLYGYYTFEADSSTAELDYSHYSVTLAKGDFSFALQANDITDNDDMRVVVSWGQEFKL